MGWQPAPKGCAVEGVREMPANPAPIAVAMSGGVDSSTVAAMLAREFGARLKVIHVTAADPDLGDSSEASWRVEVRQAAERELLRLKRFVNVEAEDVVEGGEPAKVICAAAERVEADALVIGRGSAAGMFGRLRTNAYAIIRQSPCPVVSV